MHQGFPLIFLRLILLIASAEVLADAGRGDLSFRAVMMPVN